MVVVYLCPYWGSKHTSQVLAWKCLGILSTVYKLESFGIYTEHILYLHSGPE